MANVGNPNLTLFSFSTIPMARNLTKSVVIAIIFEARQAGPLDPIYG
jgi:hypothetical protein